MPKILSQEEIDALLTTVTTAQSDADAPSTPHEPKRSSIIAYDFKHPNRVSKDQVRTLENMHDSFAGHVSSTLSAMLRTMVDVDLVSVDQINYSEYVMSLVSPSCSYIFSAEPLEGMCVIDFNPTLTFSFIDRMFGGGEKLMEIERELTGIEKTVMARIVRKVYGDLEESWSNMVPIKIEQKAFETNPQFVQIIPAGETVIVVSLQMKMFKTTGLMTICYPYVSLEPVLPQLSAQNWIDATKKKNLQDGHESSRENLMDIEVDLNLSLAQTCLKMREFMKLKVGDIVATETRIDSAAELAVAGKKKFICQPGLFGKRRAGQILKLYPIISKE